MNLVDAVIEKMVKEFFTDAIDQAAGSLFWNPGMLDEHERTYFDASSIDFEIEQEDIDGNNREEEEGGENIPDVHLPTAVLRVYLWANEESPFDLGMLEGINNVPLVTELIKTMKTGRRVCTVEAEMVNPDAMGSAAMVYFISHEGMDAFIKEMEGMSAPSVDVIKKLLQQIISEM